jgi:hypothetical protein
VSYKKRKSMRVMSDEQETDPFKFMVYCSSLYHRESNSLWDTQNIFCTLLLESRDHRSACKAHLLQYITAPVSNV